MKHKKQSKNYSAPALEKGLDILELLSNSAEGLSQAEIAGKLNKSVNEIKKLGLSKNKARTIKDLSNLFLDESNVDLSKMNDEELKEKLLSVFGIGPWSVNMFEIF